MQGILVFFFLVFVLSYRHWLPRGMGRAFGKVRAASLIETVEDVESRSVRFLWLRTIVSAITAAGGWGIMALFGVPSAIFWAVVLFVGQYVPYFGPLVASVPPILVTLAQAPSPWTAFWLGVALLGWGVLVGNVVEPRVMGKGMRLNELSVILALSFFGWMWGMVGALLAVPILVVLRIVCQRVDTLAPLAVFLGPRSAREDAEG
jgi:predicted PurR-regulated permease PerM